MIKKMLSIVLTATLCLSSLSIGFAASTNISKEKATEIAKEKIKTTFGVDIQADKSFEFNISEVTSGNFSDWFVSWYKGDENGSKNYSVTVNGDDGKVRGYYKGDYTANDSLKFVLSQEEAKKIADDYVQKLNPEEFKQSKPIAEDSMENGYIYSFRYPQMINGIEYNYNSMYVEVDKRTKEISSYSYNWDDRQKDFPSSDKIIDAKKAMDMFKNDTKMNLSYEMDSSSEKINLVYNPIIQSYLINALDGKAVEYLDQNISTKDIDKAKKDEIAKSAKEKSVLPKEITKEEAVKISQDEIKKIYNKEYPLLRAEYLEKYMSDNTNVWSLSFGTEDKEGMTEDGVQLIMNAKNAQIIELYNIDSNYENTFTPKISSDQAYDKAIEFISKNYPEKINDIKTKQDLYQDTMYDENGNKIPVRYVGFNFSRVVNGIDFYENSISVTVDRKTGEVSSYSYTWDDTLKFPDATGLIGEDKAKDIYYSNQDTVLMYALINTTNNSFKPSDKIYLVYSSKIKDLNKVGSVDAKTGNIIEYTNIEPRAVSN